MNKLWRISVLTTAATAAFFIAVVSFPEIAAAQTLNWSTATLSQSRDYLSSTSIGEKALFAGGVRGYPYTNQYSDVVDIYDASNNTWSVVNLPTQVRSPLATSLGDNAFFLDSNSRRVYIYNIFSNTWYSQEVDSCLGEVNFLRSFNNEVYIGSNSSNQLCIYNDEIESWTIRIKATSTLTSLSPTVTYWGSKVIFAGGLSIFFDYSNVVRVYDLLLDNWGSLPPLGEMRGDMGAATIGDIVIFAGGNTKGISGTKGSVMVDFYNMRTGTRTSGFLPNPGGYVTGVSYGNLAFFAGGSGCTGTGTCYVRRLVDIYDNSTSQWSTREGIFGSRAASVVVGNQVLFGGGNRYSTYSTDHVEIATFANTLPLSNAGEDMIALEGVIVSFNGSGSSDPDGIEDIASYEWDFGDGNTGNGLEVSHAYADDGVYTVTLTVTDSQGESDSDSITVTVNNVAPTVSLPSSMQVFPTNSINIGGYFSDPGADSWTATVN